MTRFVYAGVTRWRGGTLSGVFRLSLGGSAWEQKNKGFPEDIHVQTVVAHPRNPDVLFAGTSDGVYRSENSAESWERVGFPERERQIWSVCVHPTDPRIVFAGASPVEIFRSEDGGDNFRKVEGSRIPDRLDTGKFVNRVMRIAVDPNRPDNVYGGSEVNGMMRSLDGGNSWEDCNDELVKMVDENEKYRSAILTESEYEGMFDIHAICTTAGMKDAVYVACRMGLFRSRDQGLTWEDLGIGKVAPWVYGRDIKVSPQDLNVLYACISVASHGDTGGVFRSTDLGENWERVDHGVTASKTVMACALSPSDPNVVFATTRAGQVFGTLDGCKTWKEYQMPEGCLGVYALACA